MVPSAAIEQVVLDDEAVNDPTIMAIFEYWCGLNSGFPPRRTAFEFMAVYRQAPHLLMSQRIAQQTFSFIYCGTAVAENFPLDLTGKTFGPDNVQASRIPWFDYKSIALDTPCVRFGKDRFDWPNLDFKTILSGIMPLTDDHDIPRYALACLVFVAST